MSTPPKIAPMTYGALEAQPEEETKNTHSQPQKHIIVWAIQVLRNADGGRGCKIFREKALRRSKVQCY